MGLRERQALYRYESAQVDFRTCVQLSVINFVGFLVLLGIYFFNDADKLGIAMWSTIFLTLSVVCAILAKKAHKAVKYWEKQCKQNKDIIKEEYVKTVESDK